MIKLNVFSQVIIISIASLLSIAPVVAQTSPSNVPHNNPAVPNTNNPALVNPHDPTGVNSNLPGSSGSPPSSKQPSTSNLQNQANPGESSINRDGLNTNTGDPASTGSSVVQ